MTVVTHHFTDEGGQIGGHLRHFGTQVLLQLQSVSSEGHDSAGETFNVDKVDGGDVHSWKETRYKLACHVLVSQQHTKSAQLFREMVNCQHMDSVD